MSEEVTVPFGDNTSDNAVLLLAAAEELDLSPSVVRTNEGAFLVPQEVYDQAFGERESDEPAKKTAAKKTTAKKKAGD